MKIIGLLKEKKNGSSGLFFFVVEIKVQSVSLLETLSITPELYSHLMEIVRRDKLSPSLELTTCFF